ncbi:MAG: hypothetical protein OFPI_44690 [Osedax symbiont Rs2]|nr:MAG: hypothetical protein OFPI_44690 [Osedax symbiont Rs2]
MYINSNLDISRCLVRADKLQAKKTLPGRQGENSSWCLQGIH